MTEPAVTASARDLGEVALKLMGIYFILFSLSAGAAFLTATSTATGQQGGVLGAAAALLVSFAVGIALLRWSAQVSSRLFGSVSTVAIPLPIQVELQVVAYRAIGLFILAGALPNLAALLAESIVVKTWPESLPGTAAVVTQVAFGATLLLYRTEVALRTWRRLRPLARANRGAGAA